MSCVGAGGSWSWSRSARRWPLCCMRGCRRQSTARHSTRSERTVRQRPAVCARTATTAASPARPHHRRRARGRSATAAWTWVQAAILDQLRADAVVASGQIQIEADDVNPARVEALVLETARVFEEQHAARNQGIPTQDRAIVSILDRPTPARLVWPQTRRDRRGGSAARRCSLGRCSRSPSTILTTP